MALLLHLLLIYKIYTHLGKRFVCASRVRVFQFSFFIIFSFVDMFVSNREEN